MTYPFRILPAGLAVFAALSVAAQTHTTPHHTAQTAAAQRETAGGGCVTTPQLSAKIPALPAGAPCARALYTLTRVPSVKLDYASPLVSPALRSELGEETERFSLVYVDTKPGSGAPIEQHQCLSVQYTGWLEDGTTFDSSRQHPGSQPITFEYGAHHVIPGWDTGFEGMRIGGERRLFIPYQLAYGEAGRGPIPAKAELIFDVAAVAQTAPKTGVPPGQECAPEGAAGHPGAPIHPGATPPPGTKPH